MSLPLTNSVIFISSLMVITGEDEAEDEDEDASLDLLATEGVCTVMAKEPKAKISDTTPCK